MNIFVSKMFFKSLINVGNRKARKSNSEEHPKGRPMDRGDQER